jgi:AraC-like DNA-binding protein
MHIMPTDLEIIVQVKAILEKDYKHHVSQAQLAQRFQMDESKLRKLFKKVFQITIHQHLTQVRIEKAKDLLTHSEKPIKAIAYMIGYDISNLEKQFNKYTGMTPQEWRRQHQAKQQSIVPIKQS